jgi:hypothetical protein
MLTAVVITIGPAVAGGREQVPALEQTFEIRG